MGNYFSQTKDCVCVESSEPCPSYYHKCICLKLWYCRDYYHNMKHPRIKRPENIKSLKRCYQTKITEPYIEWCIDIRRKTIECKSNIHECICTTQRFDPCWKERRTKNDVSDIIVVNQDCKATKHTLKAPTAILE